jgi:ABC transport system ATP-binding/permease protein
LFGLVLEQLDDVYNQIYNDANAKKDFFYASHPDINKTKDAHFNESLAELVRNVQAKKKVVEEGGRLIPKSEPIFYSAFSVNGSLDYRAHFFAPVKHFAGRFYGTLFFNAIVIWLMCLCLYLFLFFDILSKSIIFTEKAIMKVKNLNR